MHSSVSFFAACPQAPAARRLRNGPAVRRRYGCRCGSGRSGPEFAQRIVPLYCNAASAMRAGRGSIRCPLKTLQQENRRQPRRCRQAIDPSSNLNASRKRWRHLKAVFLLILHALAALRTGSAALSAPGITQPALLKNLAQLGQRRAGQRIECPLAVTKAAASASRPLSSQPAPSLRPAWSRSAGIPLRPQGAGSEALQLHRSSPRSWSAPISFLACA